MYFAVGGRRVQSGLYRVTYTGGGAKPEPSPKSFAAERAQRLALEAWHEPTETANLDVIWTQLGSSDRFLQYAARVALEHQPVESWIDRIVGAWSDSDLLRSIMRSLQ